jgi:regulator of sigma E protease
MQNFLISVSAFLFALGAIVFVHEMGHFLVAKFFRVRVVTFSLGFGRRLWGFDYKGTDCRVSLIPLGGYVRLGGELPEERTNDPADFLNRPRWQRILFYLAGPAMNVVLSVLLIAGVFMAGIHYQAMQETSSVIGLVDPGTPADAAGLLPGDQILEVAGQPMDKWKDIVFVMTTSANRPVSLLVQRDGSTFQTEITPTEHPVHAYGEAGFFPSVRLRISAISPDSPAEKAGFAVQDELRRVNGRSIIVWNDFVQEIQDNPQVNVPVDILRDGQPMTITVVPNLVDGKGKIGLASAFYRRLPPGEALIASIRFNIEIVQRSVQILGKLLTNEIAAKSALSGPIDIAAISGRAARDGFKELIFTMGFLSISIGFMNLLPIPVLDGGHIMILLVESAMRRDLSVVVKERVTQVGFMMLMTLMAIVIVLDLAKNLPSLIPGS